jgi:hypothetical protein
MVIRNYDVIKLTIRSRKKHEIRNIVCNHHINRPAIHPIGMRYSE